jgi:hypothetical protein
MGVDDSLPDDVILLKAMLRVERAARVVRRTEIPARYISIMDSSIEPRPQGLMIPTH